MRPVTKGAAPANYPPAGGFTFAGANAAAIRQLLNRANAANVPIADCQNLWLVKVKGDPPPNGGTAIQLTRAANAIKTHVDSTYKLASVPLFTMLGGFCSYCETPMSGLLEVEHRAPKSNYPTYSTDWQNFLLSCGPCNTAKGNQPPRNVAQGWINPPNPNPTEPQLYAEIATNHYLWPDLNANAFTDLPLVLARQDIAGTWHAVPMADATNENNVITVVNVGARVIEADIPGFASVPVQVAVTGAAGRPREMIDLYQLNAFGNQVSTYDRRMMNRTQAWFTCLGALRMVAQMPQNQQALAFQILELLAAASGFYSVWLTILRFVNNAAYVRFINGTLAYFPGTNVAGLPNP